MSDADDKKLPERHGANRIVGVSPDGTPVANVTADNRYDVVGKPIKVNLVKEDGKTVISQVTMPNTRERPDVLIWNGKPYEVVTTRARPAIYRECVFLEATSIKPKG